MIMIKLNNCIWLHGVKQYRIIGIGYLNTEVLIYFIRYYKLGGEPNCHFEWFISRGTSYKLVVPTNN